MTTDPLAWFLNRGTGIVLVAVLTGVVVLGIRSAGASAGGRVPAFVIAAVHRNLGVLAVVLLAAHAGAAVVDQYVDIRWWQMFAPWRLSYQPPWLAIGVLGLDVLVIVLATSLVRDRMSHRGWQVVHAMAYPAWILGELHGLGIGTDTHEPWATATYAGTVAVVVASLAARLACTEWLALALERTRR